MSETKQIKNVPFEFTFAPLPDYGTKVCVRCGRELPLRYFPPEKENKDGRKTYCRDCAKEKVKASRERFRFQYREGKIEFTCRICGRKFYYTPAGLRNYQKQHEGKSPSFCCSDCFKKYIGKSENDN